MDDWLHRAPSGLAGKRVMRLGLAANYGIDEAGVRAAMDRGVNLFFCTSRATGMRFPLRDALRARRDGVAVVAITSVAWLGWNVRRSAEAFLRELGVDYLDAFLLGWVGVGAAITESTLRALEDLRESGKVRAIGCSTHDRPRAGKMAESSPLDMLMIRYNAAHPGAERDIFPHVAGGRPTILAYTATSWRKLLTRPKGWTGPVMSAGDCYRFQLSNEHVDLALSGPASGAEMTANLDALERGPLDPDELRWMREFGRAVHA